MDSAPGRRDGGELGGRAVAIAWSSSLKTRLVRTARASALVGRGSGEAFQLAFEGEGLVVVQASEGPFVPKHDHKGVGDWLG